MSVKKGHQPEFNAGKILHLLLWLAIAFLGISVVRSGYFYQLDGDEVFHVQSLYLMLGGFKPFADFYTIYSPLLQWLLVPISWITGFTWELFNYARFLMVILFLIRLGIFYLIAKILFGRITAVIFLLVYLLDPFTVFSSIQIRPDNLMMLIYPLGILLFIEGLSRVKPRLTLISGICFGTGLIIILKILPSVILFLAGWGVLCFIRKQMPIYFRFLGGIAIPIALYLLWAAGYGILPVMWQEMVVDTLSFNVTAIEHVPVGNFYRVENIYIFGLPGAPLTWVYAWIFMVSGFAGLYSAVRAQVTEETIWRRDTILLLAGSLVVQWGVLFFIPAVFMQYYLPVNWLVALFAAYVYTDFAKSLKGSQLLRKIYIVTMILIGSVFLCVSIIANTERSKMLSTSYIDRVNYLWSKIPEGAKIFQNILYRPISYPLVAHSFYGDRPPEIRQRLGRVMDALERDKTPYLLLDDYYISFLDSDTQHYIKNYYKLMPGETEIYKRVD